LPCRLPVEAVIGKVRVGSTHPLGEGEVDAVAVGVRAPLQIGEVADLVEHGVGINGDGEWDLACPRPWRVHEAEVEQDVRVGADSRHGFSGRAVPPVSVGVVIGPAGHPELAHDPVGEPEPVRRIFVRDTAARVVARARRAAVLDEGDVMSEPIESEDVLEVVPRHAAERTTDDVAGDDDPQPVLGACDAGAHHAAPARGGAVAGTSARSRRFVRTVFESK
jgi:hypothetical protein